MRVYYQVYIALAVAQFYIGKGIKHLTVFYLNYRQRAQGFSQHFQVFNADRCFAGFSNKGLALYTNKVANI